MHKYRIFTAQPEICLGILLFVCGKTSLFSWGYTQNLSEVLFQRTSGLVSPSSLISLVLRYSITQFLVSYISAILIYILATIRS